MMGSETRQPGAHATRGFGISLALAMLLNALLVVLKESSSPVMGWMKSVTGHHWTTHGTILIGVYLALGLVLSRTKAARQIGGRALLALCAVSAVLSCAAVVVYYVLHAPVR